MPQFDRLKRQAAAIFVFNPPLGRRAETEPGVICRFAEYHDESHSCLFARCKPGLNEFRREAATTMRR